jgi:hypothetical protein
MAFDPPLSRLERRLVWLWIMTTGTAAAALYLGVFWWWAVLIVTIPILIAAVIAPTLWIYLSVALLAWMPLRSRPRLALAVGACALLLVGLGAPAAMNARLKSAVAQAAASDRGAPVRLGPGGGTVAWLTGQPSDVRPYCTDDCLRFLITGRAQAVLIGSALRGPPVAGQIYMRLRLVPWSESEGCVLPHGIERHLYGPHLNLIVRQELCVAMDRAPLHSARLVFSAMDDGPWHWREQLPALRPAVKRLEAYGWQASAPVLLFRRSQVRASKLGGLLVLQPEQGADIGTRTDWWRSGGDYIAGTTLPDDPKFMLADRMPVPAFDNPR